MPRTAKQSERQCAKQCAEQCHAMRPCNQKRSRDGVEPKLAWQFERLAVTCRARVACFAVLGAETAKKLPCSAVPACRRVH
eukprot:36832-Pyramimonas_sp.AAC.1